jgi:hypothetical protein
MASEASRFPRGLSAVEAVSDQPEPAFARIDRIRLALRPGVEPVDTAGVRETTVLNAIARGPHTGRAAAPRSTRTERVARSITVSAPAKRAPWAVARCT